MHSAWREAWGATEMLPLSVYTFHNYSIWKCWTYSISKLDLNNENKTARNERNVLTGTLVIFIALLSLDYLFINTLGVRAKWSFCIPFWLNYSNDLLSMRRIVSFTFFFSICVGAVRASFLWGKEFLGQTKRIFAKKMVELEFFSLMLKMIRQFI